MEQYNKYQEIKDYLDDYQDLWYIIDEKGNSSLPLMDVSMELVENDQYDFSNKQAVCEMFFLGSSDYFPGFHLIDKKTSWDELPIYLFNIESGDKPSLVGNFRTYMETILKEYIEKSKNQKAKIALKKLNKFSKNMIKTKPYVLKKLK